MNKFQIGKIVCVHVCMRAYLWERRGHNTVMQITDLTVSKPLMCTLSVVWILSAQFQKLFLFISLDEQCVNHQRKDYYHLTI